MPCAGRLLHPHVVQFKEVFLTQQHLAIGKPFAPDWACSLAIGFLGQWQSWSTVVARATDDMPRSIGFELMRQSVRLSHCLLQMKQKLSADSSFMRVQPAFVTHSHAEPACCSDAPAWPALMEFAASGHMFRSICRSITCRACLLLKCSCLACSHGIRCRRRHVPEGQGLWRTEGGRRSLVLPAADHWPGLLP